VARSLVARYPERVLTIRYEDFLGDQEQTLRKVCQFFEIDYLPEMLDVTRSPEAKQISQMSALWASNCFAPISANVDKFKQQLTLEEIAIIETLALEYMNLYGYELMTDANVTIAESTFSKARERSETVKKTAWRDLEQNNYRDFILRRVRADYLARVRHRLEQEQSVSSNAIANDVAAVA
jgi:hypothetical protein